MGHVRHLARWKNIYFLDGSSNVIKITISPGLNVKRSVSRAVESKRKEVIQYEINLNK